VARGTASKGPRTRRREVSAELGGSIPLFIDRQSSVPIQQQVAAQLIVDRDSDVPIYQQIATQLRDAILSGKLPPGRPVPSKRDLRKHCGIAGVTVDKTMAWLKRERLIRHVPGMGLFVIPPDQRGLSSARRR
jgi:DNA-binding transcriptional regulator YhcF (GntR family)